MEEVYKWTPEDYKRASAPRLSDFARFNAMRVFDNLRLENSLNLVGNSHLITREDYALLMNESIQDVRPEALKKKMEEMKKKRKMEVEGGECQSEEMKIDKRPSNKNKLYDDLSPADVFQYYAESEGVGFQFIDPEDPEVQAEVAQKRKLFKETCLWLEDLYYREGPVEADAQVKAANEAIEKANEAKAKAADEAIAKARAAYEAKAKAADEAIAKARAAYEAKAKARAKAKAIAIAHAKAISTYEAKAKAHAKARAAYEAKAKAHAKARAAYEAKAKANAKAAMHDYVPLFA